MSLPATSNPPLAELAYEQIRARILDNVWPPWHRALELDVALALGMSRTPVREALIRLQSDGLVEVIPRHGMHALPISHKKIPQKNNLLINFLVFIFALLFVQVEE